MANHVREGMGTVGGYKVDGLGRGRDIGQVGVVDQGIVSEQGEDESYIIYPRHYSLAGNTRNSQAPG